MKCLRCGWCCHRYMVAIVDDPDKGITEDNLIPHKGDGTPCPHLRPNPDSKTYTCTIHDRPWYSHTPCASHGQIEHHSDAPCRMGKWLMDQGGYAAWMARPPVYPTRRGQQ